MFLGFLSLKFITLVDGTLPRGLFFFFFRLFFFESTRISCGLNEHGSPQCLLALKSYHGYVEKRGKKSKGTQLCAGI